MSSKMGRPTDEPKTIKIMVRLSENDMKMLKYCAEKEQKSKADIIRIGIKLVYKRMKRNNGNAAP